MLEKKLYSITPAGRDEFLNWMRSETPLSVTPKDISRLKLFFSAAFTKEERKAFLEDQLTQHENRKQHLLDNQKKFTGVPDRDSDEFDDYLVLLGAVRREEMTVSWLKECLDFL